MGRGERPAKRRHKGACGHGDKGGVAVCWVEGGKRGRKKNAWVHLPSPTCSAPSQPHHTHEHTTHTRPRPPEQIKLEEESTSSLPLCPLLSSFHTVFALLFELASFPPPKAEIPPSINPHPTQPTHLKRWGLSSSFSFFSSFSRCCPFIHHLPLPSPSPQGRRRSWGGNSRPRIHRVNRRAVERKGGRREEGRGGGGGGDGVSGRTVAGAPFVNGGGELLGGWVGGWVGLGG